MKKTILKSLALIGAFLFLTSQTVEEPVMTKQKDVTIINTTTLATDIEGYVSTTPVKTAAKAKVDVVTGATVSSEAVIENVRRGIAYYNYANKK